MAPSRLIAILIATLACALCASALTPAPASAISLNGVCSAAGIFSGLAGKACSAVTNGGRLVSAGKKLLSGHIGGAAKTLLGEASSKAGSTLALVAMGAWVVGGAKVAMNEAATLIDHSTRPDLASSWFSSSYWRMAGIAAVLTLPFLFAAVIQAIVRTDLALLARAALGHLPLAVLAVSIIAPVTTLLLAATDQMSAIISGAAGGDGPKALVSIGGQIGTISALDGSPFLAFLVGLFVAAGAFVLWMELLIRQAAVYIIVLMLPLAFSALVWPARRVWAVRAVELLVALILSKFAIVAVLTLGAGALSDATGITVTLAAFAPWAIVRLLPMAEIAGGAAGALRGESARMRGSLERASRGAAGATLLLGASDNDPWPSADSAGEAARAHTERLADARVADAPATAPDEPANMAAELDSGRTIAELPSSSATGEAGGRNGSDVPDAARGDSSSTPDGSGGTAVPDPDMPDQFQHGNYLTWRPLPLGSDDNGRPPPIAGPEDPRPHESGPPQLPPGPQGDEQAATPTDTVDPPAEDHNPLPPEQESEDGAL
jgi:hypothetical protein